MRRVRHFVGVVAWIACASLGARAVVAQAAAGSSANASGPAQPGQTAAAVESRDGVKPLAFDVVSIKPYAPNNMMVGIQTTPAGIDIVGMPLSMLMRQVLGFPNDRILNMPDWVKSNRYDIEAKVALDDAAKLKTLTDQERWAMFVSVLEERCGLKLHHETRDLTVYDLVIAKGGPKLRPSQTTSAQPNEPPQRNAKSGGVSISDKGITISGYGDSTATIAHMISGQVGGTVVDKTGLTGTYDYRLQFAPDESMLARMPPSGSGSPPPEMDGPSIFTAIQEQLGLKLEAHKESTDVIVIDHIEEPTVN
jgi:bla regulator protein blaR1